MYVRLWKRTFNEICGGSPQSFEPWISGWILSDLSNFHPTSSERSGRSHCSSGRLLCRLITASPHVPCWAAPALSPPAPSTPHHQKMSVFYRSSGTAPVVAQGAVALCLKKVRRRSWSLISSSGSSSCNCSSRSSCRSWSLISSSHQESVITDTPTLEAHHPAVTFFCWLRWKLLKLDFFLEWQFWFASITLFIHSWYVKQSFPIQIQNQT